MGGRASPGLEDQGRLRRCFPCPFRPWKSFWVPGPGPPFCGAPSGLMGPKGMGGWNKERWTVGGDPPGLEDQGKCGRHFLHPFWPCWAPGSGPLPSEARYGFGGPRDIVRWGGRGGEADREIIHGWGIRGGATGILPMNLAPGSLSGLQIWSPDFQGSLWPCGHRRDIGGKG